MNSTSQCNCTRCQMIEPGFIINRMFSVCNVCNSKRCIRADDHRNECDGKHVMNHTPEPTKAIDPFDNIIVENGTVYYKIGVAANRYTMKDDSEIIIAGLRHYCPVMANAFLAYQQAGLIPKDRSLFTEEQGFLDSYGNFIDRKTAWTIAVKFNQVNEERNGPPGKLYSEGLY